MALALEQARQAQAAGEVPVGAVVVKEGRVLAVGGNAPINSQDPTAHAEIVALRAAAKALGNYRLDGCTLYVTLEPCAMCTGAMLHARLARVVFGAADPKTGAAGSVVNLFEQPHLNHHAVVQGGVLNAECSALLHDFFKQTRKDKALQRAAQHPLREDALRTPDACFAAFTYQHGTSHYTSTLPVLQGLRMHYLDAAPNLPQQKTYLCLHELDSWGYAFEPAMPNWLAAGVRVIVPDLIGFGRSDKPKKSQTHTTEWHAEIVCELLAELAVHKTHLVLTQPNHPVAQHFTKTFPSLIEEMLIVSLPPLQAPALEAPFPDRGHRAALQAFRTR
jgi:tRNA(adenine34) deaminase